MSSEDTREDVAETRSESSKSAVDEQTSKPSTADIAGVDDQAVEATSEFDKVEEADADRREPLFAGKDAEQFRERWGEIQSRFVDEPRRAVEEGDALVATLMQRLAETFAEERSSLEGRWDRDEDVSTEDLRITLQRYRSFFDRLLSA
jgi:hypothetical protein